jgi:hypothetical protein
MFRSLFQDHLQGLSFALSAYHASAAHLVICLYRYVVVCPLFVCVSSVPACVLSGREKLYITSLVMSSPNESSASFEMLDRINVTLPEMLIFELCMYICFVLLYST